MQQQAQAHEEGGLVLAPGEDGPGDAAWQRMRTAHMRVMAEEQARARRN
jgi:hypothetical protein